MASTRLTLAEEFTVASMQGAYASTAVGRGGQLNAVSIGVYYFDGKGGISGSSIINLPDRRFGARSITNRSITGTYDVDPDGAGYGTTHLTVINPDGSTEESQTIFLVSKAEKVDGVSIAQELSLMQTEIEPVTGSLFMHTMIRRPDNARFTLASFQGVYGGPGIAWNGQTPMSAMGIGAVHFDGAGMFTGVDLQNLPGETFRDRKVLTFETPTGRYLVDENGTGMIIGNLDAKARLIVTRARLVEGKTEALGYFFVMDDLIPGTGNFITTYITKRFY